MSFLRRSSWRLPALSRRFHYVHRVVTACAQGPHIAAQAVAYDTRYMRSHGDATALPRRCLCFHRAQVGALDLLGLRPDETAT